MVRAMKVTLAAALLILAALALACNGNGDGDGDDGGATPQGTEQPMAGPDSPPEIEGDPIQTGTGLQYIDIVVGDGPTPEPTQTLSVHYTGWLEDGTKFDSSYDRGVPFFFTIGVGDVIRGWDEGLANMQVGGKRRLIIPTHLAYGEAGAGALVPPNANLIFDVDLLEIREPRE